MILTAEIEYNQDGKKSTLNTSQQHVQKICTPVISRHIHQ